MWMDYFGKSAQNQSDGFTMNFTVKCMTVMWELYHD
jgi:hypothetical protein